MSSELSSRKKRSVSEANPAPDGDHRKRRRNRTTQSCLNCHTSKRMCDRKRPACARCTQLGLTGLCVYEVDDPSQRSETQDESSRLLKRVAELEGVIRELKNKPHPRWVQTTNGPVDELDKWHTRSQMRAGSAALTDPPSSNAPSPPSSSSSEKGDGGSASGSSSRSSLVNKSSNVYPPSIHLATDSPRHTLSSHSSYYGGSPQSTPSPSTMTPTDEYPHSHLAIAGADLTQDYDLTSMFMNYPGLMGCEDSPYGPLSKELQPDDSCFLKEHNGHCGCLHEASSYNVVLELSLRLRKAADVLARSASHNMGSNCALHQRISDLDGLATNALGNIATPPEDLSGPLSQDRGRSNNHLPGNVGQMYGPAGCRPIAGSSITPQSLHSLRSWDLMPSVGSPVSCDDSFMSWEPPRR